MNNIYELELSLLEPAIRQSPDKLNELIADDFIEFSSSGKIYNKREVISALADEVPLEFSVENFSASKLSESVVLATYKAISPLGTSLRSSIWKKHEGKWKMAFHQGTMCKEEKMINNLGLPLEYQQMPEYFDAHNVSEETDAKNAVIERLLKEQNVNTVLDMTCGTGSQVFYLTERGYQITGSDFSPALLEQARKTAKAQNLDLTFIDGDMRDLQVGKFDAVITMFNAIGHVSKADFARTMRNIHGNLNDGGIYIFDIFNLGAITDDIIDSFKMDIQTTKNGAKIRNQQYSEVDRENRLLTSHDHYTITKRGREPEIYTNSFSLQIYTADELKQMLEQNGFEVVHQYDLYGNEFISDKSLNILTVARKK